MRHNQHDHHNINPQSDITPQTKFFNPLAPLLSSSSSPGSRSRWWSPARRGGGPKINGAKRLKLPKAAESGHICAPTKLVRSLSLPYFISSASSLSNNHHHYLDHHSRHHCHHHHQKDHYHHLHHNHLKINIIVCFSFHFEESASMMWEWLLLTLFNGNNKMLSHLGTRLKYQVDGFYPTI